MVVRLYEDCGESPFPGIVFAYGVPRLLVTKLRSINLSGIWLDECPCRLCKVESFIFIWGCLEPNLRPGWRHELVSWLFFNARIDSYRDVKKISFRGGKLTSISTLVCLATTFKHHIQNQNHIDPCGAVRMPIRFYTYDIFLTQNVSV